MCYSLPPLHRLSREGGVLETNFGKHQDSMVRVGLPLFRRAQTRTSWPYPSFPRQPRTSFVFLLALYPWHLVTRRVWTLGEYRHRLHPRWEALFALPILPRTHCQYAEWHACKSRWSIPIRDRALSILIGRPGNLLLPFNPVYYWHILGSSTAICINHQINPEREGSP